MLRDELSKTGVFSYLTKLYFLSLKWASFLMSKQKMTRKDTLSGKNTTHMQSLLENNNPGN